MIKKIREWLDKRAERKFKEKLTYTNLYLLYWQYICNILEPALLPMPLDLIISIKLKDKLPKEFQIKSSFSIDDKIFLKRFIEENGIILYINDDNLYVKTRKLEKKNIKYIITENIREFEYVNVKRNY